MSKLKEVKKIIKENNFSLTAKFYMNKDDIVITDWSYWYHFVKYEKSDLKKFKELPEFKRYKEINAGIGGSVVIN